MTGGTLFSGIGAPETALPEIDWLWSAEIEPFPSAVLAARHPQSRNLGDVTKVNWNEIKKTDPVDLVVFGSPCQSFSVAGKRAGLDDPRGNLALVAIGILRTLQPTWLVFENVPGLLSSDQGRDFGTLLAEMGQCGYSLAWRVLDAQYFGVPQRRRRVFVVGHLGDWRRSAAVLFDRESLSGNPAPCCREAGEGVAARTAPCLRSCGVGSERIGDTRGQDSVIPCLRTNHYNNSDPGMEAASLIMASTAIGEYKASALKRKDYKGSTVDLVTHSLRADGFDASEDGTGRGTPLTVAASVRRLTPRECERLQGFPDEYTLIDYNGRPPADGRRYRALGNSMAVPVVEWIGRRLISLDTPRTMD